MDEPERDAAGTRCATCGTPIDTQQWHPVVGEAADGFEVLAFCDGDCRREWLGE